MTKKTLSLQVEIIREEALRIRSYALVDPQGSDLPEFTAGAHIDLHLSNGMVRSYSLFNDPSDRTRYEFAVAKDANSRGGSIFLHDTLGVGEAIEVSLPRNNFRLSEGLGRSVFVAGGIGITPILSMVRRLETLGAEWKLYYAVRGRSQAPFLDLLATYGDRVHLHFDEEQNCVLDMAAIVDQLSGDTRLETHLYCCGPKPMLDAFQSACSNRDPETVHLEYFTGEAAGGGEDVTFLVHLAKSKLTVEVPPGVSILEVLLEKGFDIPYSCMEGTCGECEMKVLDGVPDHRDVVLSKKKRAENKVMMICCSRARTNSITLGI